MKQKIAYLYPVTVLLAACSLVYELLLAQTISFFMAHTVVWYSLTIGFYLGAMGIGAGFCKEIFKKKGSWEALFKIELLLSLCGGVAVIFVHFSYMWVSYVLIKHELFNIIGLFFFLFFGMVSAIGFLTGLELPLLIQSGNLLSGGRKITNRILGMDYFGSLLGGLAFSLILLPHFELLTIAFLIASCNLAVCLFIFFVFVKKQNKRIVKLIFVGALAVLLLVGFVKAEGIQQYLLKRYYFSKEFSKSLRKLLFSTEYFYKVERTRTPYQKIDLVKYPRQEDPFTLLLEFYSKKHQKDAQAPRGYVMFLDSFFQFDIDSEEIYHEYFAHVPVILDGKVPKTVLVLGAGDGLLMRELVKYKEIKRIVHVELDKQVIELARTHPILRYVNKNSLEDVRIVSVIADAYQYMRGAKEKYDAIYIDFPDPQNYDLSKLYSREFYFFVRNHLSENGYAVLDAPGMKICSGQERKEDLNSCRLMDIYAATLEAAGFKTVIPFTTVLETDNKQAQKFLQEKLKDISNIVMVDSTVDGKFVTEANTKEAMVKQMMQGFVDNYKQGFIMVKEKETSGKIQYKDMGVEFLVLNDKRFLLSVNPSYKLNKGRGKINSIMRPVLPEDYSLWYVRLPH